jgi:uroporphyrinogen III methyltransferase/synthase
LRNIKAKFCAIGPATAKAIKERGILPFIVAEEFVAEDLFEKMKNHIKAEDKILLPRSAQARAFLKEALIEKGCSVDEAHIYDVEKGTSPEEGVFDEVDTVLFTSPTTVRNLIAMVGKENVSQKRCIAIGPITSKELDANGIKHEVCEEYTTEGMVRHLGGV